MQNRNQTWNALYFKQTVPGVLQQTQVTAGRDQLTVGTLIQGNFKDPNAWSYTYDLKIHQRGDVYDVEFYPNWGGKRWDHHHWGSMPNFATSSYNLSLPWTGNNFTYLYNQALDRLYDKLRGSLDISIALAEAGTTARMIKGQNRLIQRVRKYTKATTTQQLRSALRRTRLPGPIGMATLIADRWLEFQYGWKPLIGDVFAAADQSVAICLNEIKRIRASARLNQYDHTQNVSILSRSTPVPVRTKAFQQVRFSCWFELPTSAWAPSKWSSLNPVSISWELLPFSFVVDWFVNVSGYLRSLETALLYSANFKSGYWTFLEVADLEAGEIPVLNWTTGSGTYKGVWTRSFDSNFRFTRTYRKFQRSVLVSSPTPYVPSFKAKLGWQRLLSGAALLTQLLKP